VRQLIAQILIKDSTMFEVNSWAQVSIDFTKRLHQTAGILRFGIINLCRA
jgi:hypothetical protein